MKPRIRTVKPEMRQDERYARLSYPARELFNGLITMADDEGRFRAMTGAILGHVFPYDEDAPRKLREWVAEIKVSGMIVFYVDDGVPYGAFRHWAKHQRINRPRASELPPPPDPDVVRANAVNDHDLISESARSDHGTDHGTDHDSISDSSRIVHTPTRRRAFRSDPFLVGKDLDNGQGLAQPERVDLLCELLAAHVHRNDPKSEPNPAGVRWRTDMRLLVADRKGDTAEVARIIDWCQQDAFWRCNILSPGKLRKQFSQLVLKSAAPSSATNGGMSGGMNASEMMRSLGLFARTEPPAAADPGSVVTVSDVDILEDTAA